MLSKVENNTSASTKESAMPKTGGNTEKDKKGEQTDKGKRGEENASKKFLKSLETITGYETMLTFLARNEF